MVPTLTSAGRYSAGFSGFAGLEGGPAVVMAVMTLTF
jgi:hypothetical protein